MTDVRCVKCRKLLFKVTKNGHSEVEVKCPKCGYLNNVYVTESFVVSDDPDLPKNIIKFVSKDKVEEFKI